MSRGASRGDQGEVQTREVFLDVAERLMSTKGFAATSVSAICNEAGVAVTSLYWHFGSKEGLLASVMERGAQQWFASLPAWDGPPNAGAETRIEAVVRGGADAVEGNPAFMRLFYLLALEGSNDPVAADMIRRVRQQAFDFFREAIAQLLAVDHDEHAAYSAAAISPVSRSPSPTDASSLPSSSNPTQTYKRCTPISSRPSTHSLQPQSTVRG